MLNVLPQAVGSLSISSSGYNLYQKSLIFERSLGRFSDSLLVSPLISITIGLNRDRRMIASLQDPTGPLPIV